MDEKEMMDALDSLTGLEMNPLATLQWWDCAVTVHNARLIDVQPGKDGFERLTIEREGFRCELLGGRWSKEYSRCNVGLWGYVQPARLSWGVDLPEKACYFHVYPDQSLRRVPELDASERAAGRTAGRDERAAATVGWRCMRRPQGFLAPAGVIPGPDGQFVPDETVAVTLRVPPEFVRECRRVQLSPEALLRSFVGDLAGVQNLYACPRADDYGSNGSDERDYAQAWLQRAHGMNAVDLEALEFQAEEDRERQYEREDFAALLDEFEGRGGKTEDLFAAVQALVDLQAAAQGA